MPRFLEKVLTLLGLDALEPEIIECAIIRYNVGISLDLPQKIKFYVQTKDGAVGSHTMRPFLLIRIVAVKSPTYTYDEAPKLKVKVRRHKYDKKRITVDRIFGIHKMFSLAHVR